MWKENNTKNGYTYFRNEDTCSFCQTFKEESPYPGRYCWSGRREKHDCNHGELISITKYDNFFSINLSEVVPGKNESGEAYKISIILDNKSGIIDEKMDGCEYDDSFSWEVTPDLGLGIVESMPLFNEENISLEEIFGIKFDIFKGTKKEWCAAYQNWFEKISMLIETKGKVEPPLFESPLIKQLETWLESIPEQDRPFVISKRKDEQEEKR